MNDCALSVFTPVLLTAVGIATTYLVGRKTDNALNRFIQGVATPTLDTIRQMNDLLRPLPEEIGSLKGLIDGIVTPMKDIADTLMNIEQEFRRRQ